MAWYSTLSASGCRKKAVALSAATMRSQELAPGSRVVYVDNDDVAVAHSRLLLDGNPDAAVIQGDLREPAKILADPETQLLLDFAQPVAVFLVAVLHFLPDTGQAADVVPPCASACPRKLPRHLPRLPRRAAQPGDLIRDRLQQPCHRPAVHAQPR